MRLEGIITNVKVGEPYFAKNLLVFPLVHEGGFANGNGQIMTLDEAFRKGLLSIHETGQIDAAILDYKGENPLFIIDGEAIYGALQDRVVNTAIWAHSSVKAHIPVSCVEQGRWSGSHSFYASNATVFPSLRAVLASSVTDSLRRTKMFETKRFKAERREERREPERPSEPRPQRPSLDHFLFPQRGSSVARAFASEQQLVWRQVRSSAMGLTVSSITQSVRDIFEAPQVKDKIQEYIDEIEIDENTVGLMAFLNDRLLAIDLFANSELLGKLKDKIVRGYAVDAMLAKGRTSRIDEKQAIETLYAFGDFDFEEYDGAIDGTELRYKDKKFVARALLDDNGSFIHMSAFDLKATPEKPKFKKSLS